MSSHRDSRAFDGARRDVSLEALAAQLGVTIPECAVGIRYFASDGIQDNLYLRFTADSPCFSRYRERQRLSDKSAGPVQPLSFAASDVKGLDWGIREGVEFDFYLADVTGTHRDVELSVYRDEVDQLVLVYAFEM
ncbi:hypothetical protein ACFO1B_40590 [Dactylosporangium siamense]|uniref:hypothetical protein n=1 Tax=Dactylosporangium siamense TaxID=685454 RepID=UPI001942722C|nr:hypothetical protein [Dactylosporangium siamense]